MTFRSRLVTAAAVVLLANAGPWADAAFARGAEAEQRDTWRDNRQDESDTLVIRFEDLTARQKRFIIHAQQQIDRIEARAKALNEGRVGPRAQRRIEQIRERVLLRIARQNESRSSEE